MQDAIATAHEEQDQHTEVPQTNEESMESAISQKPKYKVLIEGSLHQYLQE